MTPDRRPYYRAAARARRRGLRVPAYLAAVRRGEDPEADEEIRRLAEQDAAKRRRRKLPGR